MPPLPTYATIEHWRQYQRFFPAPLRCEGEASPIEAAWRWRGLDVHLDRYPAKEAKLKIVLLHGGGGHGRLLSPIAIALRRGGYAVVAPDLPGYGLTRAPAAAFHYDSWVDCCVELVAEENARDGLPVVVFGLSLGGMLAYHTAARQPHVVGVIATTLCDPRERSVREAFVSAPVLADTAVPVLGAVAPVLGALRLPIRWVSKMDRIANDAELARLVSADPLAGGCRTPIGFLLSLFQMRPAIEPEAFTRCPVLLAHPGADRWTPLDASLLFYERLACAKTLVVLENCGHIPIEEPGMTQLQEAVGAFLAERVATRGAGGG